MSEARDGLDPSMYVSPHVPSRRSVVPHEDPSILRSLLSDFDRGVALLLAEFGPMPQATLHTILTGVTPDGIGVRGLLDSLSRRYGLDVDWSRTFALSSTEAVYRKLISRRRERGIYATVRPMGGTLSAAWTLSPRGVAALLATSTLNLDPRQIRFPTSPDAVGLGSLVHDYQVAALAGSLLVESARMTSEDQWIEVHDILGPRTMSKGSAMIRPDLSAMIYADGSTLGLWVENDSGSMSERRTRAKCEAYLRIMMRLPDAQLVWARPVLAFVCPASKVRLHERAIRRAVDSMDLTRVADPSQIGRIIVGTHEDIGGLGAYGPLWRPYRYSSRSFGNARMLADLGWSLPHGRQSVVVPAA